MAPAVAASGLMRLLTLDTTLILGAGFAGALGDISAILIAGAHKTAS